MAARPRPETSTRTPAALATVPPTFDGLPARLTEGPESGARSPPQAVQYGTTPR